MEQFLYIDRTTVYRNDGMLKDSLSKRYVWWGCTLAHRYMQLFQSRFQMLYNAFIMRSTAK